jgi:NAD(P)-dependent dehydrogenase (short-subunit alcohol dehydrogenase family)
MQDKPVALVTGANRGIGFQIAKDLAAHGFTVLVGSRNLEQVHGSVVRRVESRSSRARPRLRSAPDAVASSHVSVASIGRVRKRGVTASSRDERLAAAAR